jgi:hypothetical protein
MAEKKYRLTEDTIIVNGRTLYRIQALLDFGNVKMGDIGGYVQSEDNLFHHNDAWIYDNAKVYDMALLTDDAKIYGKTEIYGNARVRGKARLNDEEKVFGETEISGNTQLCGKITISSNNDYFTIQPFGSRSDSLTLTRDRMAFSKRISCTWDKLLKNHNETYWFKEQYKKIIEFANEFFDSI